jgi:DegV family protein with EDD domain
MIAIVTDSTSDLPPDVAQQHQIEILPIYVHIGDSTFRAGVNLTNEQFLYRLQTSIDLPKTEPPGVDDFREVYQRLLAKYSHIASIHISSHLSKTFDNALAAKEALGNPNIHVLNTLSNSGGLGLMVLEAARMAAADQPLEAILKQIEAMSIHHRLFFIVNTLEYLYKSGRVDRLRSLLGNVLQMKPVFTLQEGRIELLEQVRTKPKAVARLRQLTIDNLAGRSNVHMSVFHVAAPDEAKRLADDLAAVVEPVHMLFCEAGPSISANVGPGALGVAFYSDK